MKNTQDKQTGHVEETLQNTNLEGQGGTTSAAAAPAKESEFQAWWKEITGQEGRVLGPGIYDVQEPNEYYLDRFGNESLEQAKEFIGENKDFVVAMVPTPEDDTYIILSQRPEPFQGEVHGHREGILFLSDCPDNVLLVSPIPSRTGEDQGGTTNELVRQ